MPLQFLTRVSFNTYIIFGIDNYPAGLEESPVYEITLHIALAHPIVNAILFIVYIRLNSGNYLTYSQTNQ